MVKNYHKATIPKGLSHEFIEFWYRYSVWPMDYQGWNYRGLGVEPLNPSSCLQTLIFK